MSRLASRSRSSSRQRSLSRSFSYSFALRRSRASQLRRLQRGPRVSSRPQPTPARGEATHRSWYAASFSLAFFSSRFRSLASSSSSLSRRDSAELRLLPRDLSLSRSLSRDRSLSRSLQFLSPRLPRLRVNKKSFKKYT